MTPFRGVDYLDIDTLFDEQELLVRQTARQFVSDRVEPLIRDAAQPQVGCYTAN